MSKKNANAKKNESKKNESKKNATEITMTSVEFMNRFKLSQPEASIILNMLESSGQARKVGSIKTGKRGRPTLIWGFMSETVTLTFNVEKGEETLNDIQAEADAFADADAEAYGEIVEAYTAGEHDAEVVEAVAA